MKLFFLFILSVIFLSCPGCEDFGNTTQPSEAPIFPVDGDTTAVPIGLSHSQVYLSEDMDGLNIEFYNNSAETIPSPNISSSEEWLNLRILHVEIEPGMHVAIGVFPDRNKLPEGRQQGTFDVLFQDTIVQTVKVIVDN